MGRRTAAMLAFLRFLRTTKPKYSLEVFIFNVVVLLACIVFVVLGETRLWAFSCGMLCLSLGIHWLRIRRAVKRELAITYQMIGRLEQALVAYEQMCARRHKPVDPAELALLREDVERAREREAAGGE